MADNSLTANTAVLQQRLISLIRPIGLIPSYKRWPFRSQNTAF